MNVPLHVQRLAAHWIFPGLVIAMVVGNQQWAVGPFLLGQMLSWVNDAAAAVIVFGRFQGRRWPVVLVAAIVLTKLASAVPALAAQGDLAFDISLSLLFCAAGAIIVSERPGLVYRQLVVFCMVSLPLMLLQILGVGAWAEALNTENVAGARAPQPTLFVGLDELNYRTAQARPAAFTHSNNFLSLLAAFAVALHFSRIQTARLTKRDVIVCSFALLTMAKVVLLLYVVVLGWKFINGVRRERVRVLRVGLFTVAFLTAYWVLFPGLFASNVSWWKIQYSFAIRANELADLMAPNSAMAAWLKQLLAGTPRANWDSGGSLSGYAQVIGVLPYLAVAGLLMLPILYRGFSRVRRRYPEVVDLTVLTLFVVVLYPTAVPLLRAQIFWFIAGFALLPIFTVWEPRRFPGSLGRLSPHPHPGLANGAAP